jgi:hypothetical protein
MSTQALMQICLLIERLGAWCEAWADLAISALLANFRLWTFASPDVQVGVCVSSLYHVGD